MKLVVGLGNPGPKYAGTRHNVGFEVVDRLAARWRVGLGREQFHGWFGQTDVDAERVGVLKPTTWMNRSGQAVAAAVQFFKLGASDLVVIVDDLALPLGKLRMRASGSSGGHNGLQDIIERLGSEAWARVRVGIGEAEGVTSQYVLSKFSEDERAVINGALDRAADMIECWVRRGPESAMNDYNG